MSVFYKSKNFKSKTEFDIMRDIAYAFIKNGYNAKMYFVPKSDEIIFYENALNRKYLFIENDKYYLSQDGIDLVLNFFEKNIKFSLKKKYIKGFLKAVKLRKVQG